MNAICVICIWLFIRAIPACRQAGVFLFFRTKKSPGANSGANVTVMKEKTFYSGHSHLVFSWYWIKKRDFKFFRKLTGSLCFLIKIRMAFFKGLESYFWTVWTKK